MQNSKLCTKSISSVNFVNLPLLSTVESYRAGVAKIPRPWLFTIYAESLSRLQKPIIDTVYTVANKYIEPINYNTWAFPLQFGAATHLVATNILALESLEKDILPLFAHLGSHQQQEIAEQVMLILPHYFAIHDGKDGKMLKAANGDFSPKFMHKHKNKFLEELVTKIKLCKLYLDVDLQETHDSLCAIINNNPEIATQKLINIDPNLKQQLDNLNQKCNHEIQQALNNSSDQDADLYNTMNILLADTIGRKGMQQLAKKQIKAEDYQIIAQNVLNTINNEYQSLPKSMQKCISYNAYKALRITIYLGDIRYYPKLSSSYINHYNQMHASTRAFFNYIVTGIGAVGEITVDIETECSDIDQNNKINADAWNDNAGKSNLWAVSLTHSASILKACGNFTAVDNLTKQIEISKQKIPPQHTDIAMNSKAFGVNFYTICAEKNKNLMRVIQNPVYADYMKTLVSKDFFAQLQ